MLKPVTLGLAFGILWGACLAICIILTKLTGYPGLAFYEPIKAIYFGVDFTWFGALAGGVCGFIDGFFGGLIFGWLYNLLERK